MKVPHSFTRRMLSFLLVVAMLFSTLSFGLLAAEGAATGSAGSKVTSKLPKNPDDLVKYLLMKELLESNFRKLNPSSYAPDDEVIFLVKLSEEPVLEAKSSKTLLSDYLASSAGTKQLRKIEKEQLSVLSVIQNRYTDDMEVLYRYNTVYNGFSVKTTSSVWAAKGAMELRKPTSVSLSVAAR